MRLTPKSYSLDIVFARTSAHIIQKNESERIRRWVRQLSSLVSSRVFDFALHQIQRMQSELAANRARIGSGIVGHPETRIQPYLGFSTSKYRYIIDKYN